MKIGVSGLISISAYVFLVALVGYYKADHADILGGKNQTTNEINNALGEALRNPDELKVLKAALAGWSKKDKSRFDKMVTEHAKEFAATNLPLKINSDRTWLDFRAGPQAVFLTTMFSEHVSVNTNFIATSESFDEQYTCSLPLLGILLLLDYEINIQYLDYSGAFKHSFRISREDCEFD